MKVGSVFTSLRVDGYENLKEILFIVLQIWR